MELKAGNRVTHKKKPEWGPGQILQLEEGGKVTIFFVNYGKCVMQANSDFLEPASAPDAAHPYFEQIDFDVALAAPDFKSVRACKAEFLRNYEGGFYGHKFNEQERNYKEEGCKKAAQQLAKSALEPLIKANNYPAVLAKVRDCVRLPGASGQIASWQELDHFAKACKVEENQKNLAETLYQLLHGERPISERFTNWCKLLANLGVAKWPLATMPLFVLYPNEHISVKPETTKGAAEACGRNILYEPAPNWSTYNAILKFANDLKKDLADLQVRDMIDVQSFMWGILPATKKRKI